MNDKHQATTIRLSMLSGDLQALQDRMKALQHEVLANNTPDRSDRFVALRDAVRHIETAITLIDDAL